MRPSVRNVHELRLPSSMREEIVAGIEHLGTGQDVLWPDDRWWPMELDAPPADGGRGGHGPVRYRCTQYRPGFAEFTFHRVAAFKNWNGTHSFQLLEDGDEMTLRLELVARPGIPEFLIWKVFCEPLHNALVDDMFANCIAMRHDFAPPGRRKPFPRWIRILRRLVRVPS